MKKYVRPVFFFIITSFPFRYSHAQFAPSYEWAKCYGGSLSDYGEFVCATNDGGYLIARSSTSNDGNISGHHGNTSTYDYWLAKLNMALPDG